MKDLDEHLPAIVAGDLEAFGRWVAGAELPLRTSLHRFAAVVDVEAVVQEALLRTWQVAARFRSDGEPNGLLRMSFRIAKNLAIDLARRHRADPAELAALAEQPAAHHAPSTPDPFLRSIVLGCRNKLPDKPKLALAQRLWCEGGEPDQLLAKRAKMELNTFLQNVTRARKLMAECLRKQGVDLAAELA
jgi:DNA-directed RNA polymerase specialized sigma24 family protein